MHVDFGDSRSLSLHVAGEIRGADVEPFCDVLAHLSPRPGKILYLDVSGLTSWSIVAQVAVLRAAEELAAKHCRLVLTGASLGLRRQSQRLDVFNRVQAVGQLVRAG